MTVQELRAFLELNVEDADRHAFLRGEERLASVLRNMLRTRAAASAALEEGLLQEPIAAAETYDAAMNFLARKQLERVAKRSELSDYQQQARERYLRDQKSSENLSRIRLRICWFLMKLRAPKRKKRWRRYGSSSRARLLKRIGAGILGRSIGFAKRRGHLKK